MRPSSTTYDPHHFLYNETNGVPMFSEQCRVVDLLLSGCIWVLVRNRTEDALDQEQTDSQQYVLFSKHSQPCVSENTGETFCWQWMSSWCFWSHTVLSLHLCQRNPINPASRKSVFSKVDWQYIEWAEIHSSADTMKKQNVVAIPSSVN